MNTFQRFAALFLSFALMAYGASLQISVSYVGTEPWTAFHKALGERSLTVGTWTIIIQCIFLIATYIFGKQLPKIGTFLNMMFVGVFIDIFLYLDIQLYFNSFVLDLMVFILAITISSLGIALAIYTDLGPGSKTQFYVMLHQVYGMKLTHSKFLVEAIAFTGVLILGGDIFIGTIIFLWLSPILVDTFLKLIKKRLGN